MKPALLCACSLAALSLAQSVAAAPTKRHGHTVFQSASLWSTVDICNTKQHPRTIGVRGSMPGSGVAKERMFMRFQVQYRTATGTWGFVGPQADSGFIAVGPATFKARQTGRSFLVAAKGGASYVLRGVVSFQWRRGDRVVRQAQKATRSGHSAVAGSDPKGYSAATCTLAP